MEQQEATETQNQLSPEQVWQQIEKDAAEDDGVTPFGNPICHVADTACVRVYKEILALKSARYNAHPLSVVYGCGELMEQIGQVRFHRRNDSLARIIKMLPFETIYHCHVEPAGIAAFVRKVCPKSPIVLDVHDADWGRGKGFANQLECEDIHACDVAIVPSERYRDIISTFPSTKREAHIVRSTCIGQPPEASPYPRLGGIMYMGGMDLGGWRDYRALFALLVNAGVNVYAYAPGAAGLNTEYAKTGVVLQEREYLQMLSGMCRHDWSLVCPPRDGCGAWDTAMPNKFYESLWCGVPLLTYGCQAVAKEVADHRLGLVFNDREELVQWAAKNGNEPPTDGARQRCRDYMKSRTMETQVPVLRKAYISAILHRARIATGMPEQQDFSTRSNVINFASALS